eukprot:8257528-Pyramimonas_sp.AAC.1
MGGGAGFSPSSPAGVMAGKARWGRDGLDVMEGWRVAVWGAVRRGGWGSSVGEANTLLTRS